MLITLPLQVEPIQVSNALLWCDMISNPLYRLLATISCSSPPGARCPVGREIVRRWDRQAKQMVDVIPKETFHEQKLGLINSVQCTLM